ncbi:hypothetical protein [Nonomuraea helvata]|uniref:Uncharacterized protein n=1 Tax=Nonomuraea helvata TaxID=37484 RepID=A0ABV5RXV4_9ACTN
MGLDLNLVPDVVKPVAQPLAGGAIPDADVGGIIAEAETLEHLADLLAKIKAEDAHAVVRMLRGWEWQGPAKEAFEQAFAALGGEADAAGRPSAEALIDRLAQALREESASLRRHGVRMQQTEWMIYASLALLGVMIVRLLVWIYVNGPAVLRLIQHHTLLTQVKIETVKRLVLVNMVKFAAISGGLDFGVQVAQQIWGAREAGDFDLESLAMSLGSGALTGALFAGANAGLSRLLSRPMVYVASEAELAVRDRVVAITQSMYGQALLGGMAGTAGAVPGLALSGQLDAEHLAYTFISGVAGGLDIPASARVSFVPMRAVAEIGDPPLIGTSHADPPHAPDGPPHAPDGPPPPAPRALEPHQPGSPGDHTPPATGHDTTALVQHPRPEDHADTSTDHDQSQSGDVLLQPYPSPVIMGEVTRRHDTPLPGPVGDRAGHGGTPARAPQGLPADRTPTGEAAPASAPVSSRLTRGSMLPATVPSIISTTPDDAGTPEPSAQGTDSPPKAVEKRHEAPEAAEPASAAHSRPERPEQSPADDPAPHPPRDHGSTPETRTSTLAETPQDQPVTRGAPEPVVGPAAARPVTRALADSGIGDSRPSTPDPTPPAPAVGPVGPSPSVRPVGTPPAPAERPWGTPPDIPGEFSPIADPRPRNFAEAAATVHRWTPGSEGRDALDEGLLAEGRRLVDQLPVLDHGDTTARALASMSRVLQWHDPRRAIPEIAAELGLDRDVDALVDLYGDARRHGLAPDSATDRAGLTDILKRSMEADPHRWAGQRHHTLFSLQDVTAAQARTVGLMVHMMGEAITYRSAREFVRPVLERHGIRDTAQLLPVVRAAHENGYLLAGPDGETAFHTGMDRFRQEDPYLWDGVLLAERHSLTDPGDETARLVALLDEHAPPPGAGADRAVPPLERLAADVGQGRSVEQLVRLAEDAQAHGADLVRADSPHELTGLLNAHRARDPHLWDGLRIAAERGIAHPGGDDARALSRLAEITGAEAPSRLWVFDPLRRLAGEAGLDHSVERLAQCAAEAHRAGFDLFGPVDRWQVIDALTRNTPISRPPDVPPGLHDLSPSTVRDARQAAIHEHAEAQQAYQRAHPRMRRALSRFAGTDALAVAQQERVASLEARAQAWQRRPELPEVSFTRDFAAFRRAYDQALERAARGEPVIPYMPENATASLGARDGGRGFGLELEFDLPGPATGRVLEDIAHALHEAGLTGDAQVHSHHTMLAQGYRSGKNGGRGLWRLEKDGTVAGELISPILYDEPATWENLRIACEIIRAHGGTATVSTGGHVHVSTHDYDHIVEHYTGMLDYVDHHSDTLFRLGHNPERESHRGLQYCQPNQRPAAGYESMAPMRNSNSNRKVAVNMAGMKGSSKDHIEFRLWDGSLDPAVIQSQTKVSIALVEAVLRNAPLGDLPNMGRRDRLGTHAGLRKLGAALDLTERGSLSFRSLVDELFWRAADKEQLTALYAATRWVRAR